jgi:aryl-alcohol dehydrogenase-like predicted oxidoreductase
MQNELTNGRIILGTAQFGFDYGLANTNGKVCSEDVGTILAIASAAGFDSLDTAISYGTSETVLGKFGVNDWNVITKLPAIPENCLDISSWVYKEIHGSLNRLKIPKLYSVLLHNPDDLLSKYSLELIDALTCAQSDGLFEKLGVSIYNPEDLSSLMKYARFDLVQAPLNILDRRLVESGWAHKLSCDGIEVHARSIFLQGLLLLSEDRRPSKFSQFDWLWSEWSRWLSAVNLNPLQACLAYVMGLQDIHKLVVGIDAPNQLREIIEASTYRVKSAPVWSQKIDPLLINPSLWGGG